MSRKTFKALVLKTEQKYSQLKEITRLIRIIASETIIETIIKTPFLRFYT